MDCSRYQICTWKKKTSPCSCQLAKPGIGPVKRAWDLGVLGLFRFHLEFGGPSWLLPWVSTLSWLPSWLPPAERRRVGRWHSGAPAPSTLLQHQCFPFPRHHQIAPSAHHLSTFQTPHLIEARRMSRLTHLQHTVSRPRTSSFHLLAGHLVVQWLFLSHFPSTIARCFARRVLRAHVQVASQGPNIGMSVVQPSRSSLQGLVSENVNSVLAMSTQMRNVLHCDGSNGPSKQGQDLEA